MDYKKVLELIVEHLEEGIIIVDSNFNIIYFNEPSTNITGFNPESAIGNKIFNVFPNIDKENSTFWKVMNNGEPIIEHLQNYINYKGKNVSIITSTIPIIESNKIWGAIEIFRDLTNVKELSEKVSMLHEALYRKNNKKYIMFENGTQYTVDDIIGENPGIKHLRKVINKIADSSSPVYVYGETGTGKELVVQGIHNSSNRRNKQFIAQNCAALPETLLESILFGTVQGSFTGAKDKPGLLELADGGTLFLDELNSMDLGLQSKLLRVLQDGLIRRVGSTKTKKVDVRIIAASNIEPRKLVENGILREDLYYRLNVIHFEIPPLRKRKEDIPILTNFFIDAVNKKMNKSVKGVDREVMEFFYLHEWPGNVRELQNTIESAMNFVENEYITMEDLNMCNFHYADNQNSKKVTNTFINLEDVSLKEAVEEYEKMIISNMLKKTEYNCAKAARFLNVPKQTLHGKIKRYGLLCSDKKK